MNGAAQGSALDRHSLSFEHLHKGLPYAICSHQVQAIYKGVIEEDPAGVGMRQLGSCIGNDRVERLLPVQHRGDRAADGCDRLQLLDMLVYIRLGAQALDGCRKLPGKDGQQALIDPG